MLFNTMSLSLLLLVISFRLLVSSSPTSHRSTTGTGLQPGDTTSDGHTVGILQFHGNIQGVDFHANGSLLEIIAQFQMEHAEIPLNFTPTDDLASRRDARKLAPRNEVGLICIPVPGWSWNMAVYDSIVDQLNLFGNFPGYLILPAGDCARIACEDDSAIWLCNSAAWTIWADTSEVWLDGYTILFNCNVWQYGFQIAGGQLFDSDNWNVIVSQDLC